MAPVAPPVPTPMNISNMLRSDRFTSAIEAS